MSIGSYIAEAAWYVEIFQVSTASRLSNTLYKGSSTKKGNNYKEIKARRKKNKNKKTHRK